MCRQRISGAALVVAFAVLGGCSVPGRRLATGPLRPSPDPVEADIPIPVGFRLEDRSSEDWASGRVRYVRHRYSGIADKYAVRRFYREQMPLVRWSPQSENLVDGRHTLRFKRPRESCTIRVSDADSGRAGAVTVEVLIAPEIDGGV